MSASPKDYHPELRVFKHYFDELVNSIPPSLAMEFKTEVDTTGLPESQRVSKLLNTVEDQMVVNPSIFHKFVTVLRADPSLVHIADALSDEYRK